MESIDIGISDGNELGEHCNLGGMLGIPLWGGWEGLGGGMEEFFGCTGVESDKIGWLTHVVLSVSWFIMEEDAAGAACEL